LEYEPGSMAGIKEAQRKLQDTVGIPVPILKSIAKSMKKSARSDGSAYLPLSELLWDEYGREGRVIAAILLGAIELETPDIVLPILLRLSRSCFTWEDADRIAMDAVEPIVRMYPETWLEVIEPWLEDGSKWVRRAAIIVIGRLPMKHPLYAARCLALAEKLLLDVETDVKKAVSFAIRLTARGDLAAVCQWLERVVPPEDSAATWVLCDVIRSMTKTFIPELAPLRTRYELWAHDPGLSSRDRRSVESALSRFPDI
jgi:3-methyladenine DNA glycosylase AlkD